MFPYIALAKDKFWQPGPYEGVELKILHKNAYTGGVVVLRKFKAGYIIPAHTHPLANEWAYVLSGEWDEFGTIPAARCSSPLKASCTGRILPKRRSSV